MVIRCAFLVNLKVLDVRLELVQRGFATQTETERTGFKMVDLATVRVFFYQLIACN